MEKKTYQEYFKAQSLKQRALNLIKPLPFLIKKGVEALEELQNWYITNNQKGKRYRNYAKKNLICN